MNSNTQFIVTLNKFSQLLHFLNEYTDLRNLWMASPDLWNSNERRFLCYLKLKKNKSREYLESKNFREYIISRVTDPSKHISLNLIWCSIRITDVSSLGNVHTLDLSYCTGITDVSSLRNVHTLYLSDCEKISDMGSLGNVNKVYVPYSYYTDVADMNFLRNVNIVPKPIQYHI